jgi:hypothetical protein
LEQAQKALENTCRQNEKMMDQLEKTRAEETDRLEKSDTTMKSSLRKFFRVDAEIQEMRKLQLCNLFADFEMKEENISNTENPPNNPPMYERQKMHEVANGLIADEPIRVETMSKQEIDQKMNSVRKELKHLLRNAIAIDQESKSWESFSRCHKLTNMFHPGLTFK